MPWRLCSCVWSLWRHSRAMRAFLIADPSQTFAFSRGLFVDWVSDPSSLRVGTLVVLGGAFESDRPS